MRYGLDRGKCGESGRVGGGGVGLMGHAMSPTRIVLTVLLFGGCLCLMFPNREQRTRYKTRDWFLFVLFAGAVLTVMLVEPIDPEHTFTLRS